MSFIVKLAQQAAEEYVRYNQSAALPYPLPHELAAQRACYVTVYEKPGRTLRGMYGQVLPRHSSLAQEVIHNTIEALRIQYNRPPRPADLPYFVYTVAVLGPMERITSSVHLNPTTHGLYVRSDRDKSAVILPQRTGIDTGDDQIATAMREAGVTRGEESVTMYRFGVTYYD